MAVIRMANIEPVVSCIAWVAQISRSWAAPRYCDRLSISGDPYLGRRTMTINPSSAMQAVCQRGRLRARAQPTPKPKKHSSSARFLT